MRHFLFGIVLLAMAVPTGALTATLPNSTSPGYPYVFNATLSQQKSVPCMLTASDKFGSPAQAWTLNGDGFPMFTDTRGDIAAYVRATDAFVLGENYTFRLSCGSESVTQQVSVVGGGTAQLSIWFLNALDWANSHQSDATLIIIIGVLGLIGAGVAYGVVTNRRRLW